MALCTLGRFDVTEIDVAYEREVRSLRWVSLGVADDQPLGIERRAQAVGKEVGLFLEGRTILRDEMKTPTASDQALPESLSKTDPAQEKLVPVPASGRMAAGITQGVATSTIGRWWIGEMRPRLKRFIPLLYVRMEVFFLAYVGGMTLVILTFFAGEYFSRQFIREGKHKKNYWVDWIKNGLRTVLYVCIASAGLVSMPPVVWWIIPCVLMSLAILVLVRAYTIEIRG